MTSHVMLFGFLVMGNGKGGLALLTRTRCDGPGDSTIKRTGQPTMLLNNCGNKDRSSATNGALPHS